MRMRFPRERNTDGEKKGIAGAVTQIHDRDTASDGILLIYIMGGSDAGRGGYGIDGDCGESRHR
jgi:hypothetical protein